FQNFSDRDVNGLFSRQYFYIGMLWRFVGCANTREIINLATARFFIQAFDIALFASFYTRIDKYLNKVLFSNNFGYFFTIRSRRRYKGGQDDRAGINKKLGYLCNAAQVLGASLWRKI